MTSKFIEWLQFTYVGRLGKPLSPITAADYVKYFSVSMNAAVRAEIIPENPFMSLTPQERVKVSASKLQFLTIDEIKLMAATDSPRLDVKQAYLFACYCGLRLRMSTSTYRIGLRQQVLQNTFRSTVQDMLNCLCF